MEPLEADEKSAREFFEQGNELKSLGRLYEALAAYKQACRLKPDFADAYYERGYVLQNLDRNREALVAYRWAVKLDPGKIEAVMFQVRKLTGMQIRAHASTIFTSPAEDPDLPPQTLPGRTHSLWTRHRLAWAIISSLLFFSCITALCVIPSHIIGASNDATATAWANTNATSQSQDDATQRAIAFQNAQATEISGATATASAAALFSLAKNLKARDPGSPYSPYLAGKLLVIDQQNHEVDTTILFNPDGTSLLPANLRAITPDQVGTILFLDCSATQVGTYGRFPKEVGAFQRNCTATIVNRRKALVVGKKDFAGPPPPAFTLCPASGCTQDVYGDYPAADIAQYVEGLPGK